MPTFNYNLYVDDPEFSQFEQDVYSGKTKVDKLNFSSPALKPPALATTTLTPAPKQVSNNFDSIDYSTGFDAMAGYDKAKSAYLDELGKNKKRFNYGKAVSKFNEMWKADEGNRLTQYRRTNAGKHLDDLIADNRAKLFDIQESARQDIAELQQKNELANSQIVADAPVVTNSTPQGLQWQRDNGLVADRKFGNNSIAKYNELKAQQAEADDPEIQKWNTNPNPYSNGNLQSTINSINPQSPQTPTPSSLIDELIASNKLQTGWGYGHLSQDNQKIINEFLKSKGQTVPSNLTRWGMDDWYKKYFGEDEFNRLKKYIRTYPVQSKPQVNADYIAGLREQVLRRQGYSEDQIAELQRQALHRQGY